MSFLVVLLLYNNTIERSDIVVNSNKIKELINESSEVFITPHKNIDLDALGSSLGLYYIANHFNKKAYIIIDDENKSKEVIRAISTTQN